MLCCACRSDLRSSSPFTHSIYLSRIISFTISSSRWTVPIGLIFTTAPSPYLAFYVGFYLAVIRQHPQHTAFMPLSNTQRTAWTDHATSLIGHGPHALSPLRGSHSVNAKSKARQKSASPNTNNQKYPIVSTIQPPSRDIK